MAKRKMPSLEEPVYENLEEEAIQEKPVEMQTKPRSMFVINQPRVNIREEPNRKSKIVGVALLNDLFTGTKLENDWTKVRSVKSDRREGYILSEFLREI